MSNKLGKYKSIFIDLCEQGIIHEPIVYIYGINDVIGFVGKVNGKTDVFIIRDNGLIHYADYSRPSEIEKIVNGILDSSHLIKTNQEYKDALYRAYDFVTKGYKATFKCNDTVVSINESGFEELTDSILDFVNEHIESFKDGCEKISITKNGHPIDDKKWLVLSTVRMTVELENLTHKELPMEEYHFVKTICRIANSKQEVETLKTILPMDCIGEMDACYGFKESLFELGHTSYHTISNLYDGQSGIYQLNRKWEIEDPKVIDIE